MLAAVICVLGVIVAGAQGQIKSSGTCPGVTIPALTTAQLARFQSNSPWMENKRYYSMFEKNARCVSWSYVVSGTSLTATTTMVDGPWGGSTMISSLTQSSQAGDYFYRMILNPLTGRSLSGTYNYQIIGFALTGADTDWILAYSCRNKGWFNSYHVELMWVLSKQRTLTAAQLTAIQTAATTAGVTINQSQLRDVTQNC